MICYKCGSFTADGERKCSVCGQLFASDRRRTKRPATAKSNSDGPFPKGQILGGRYVMEGNPTASASGWTYRAKDQKDNVWVAVKVIDAKLLQTESERSKFVSALKKGVESIPSMLVENPDPRHRPRCPLLHHPLCRRAFASKDHRFTRREAAGL